MAKTPTASARKKTPAKSSKASGGGGGSTGSQSKSSKTPRGTQKKTKKSPKTTPRQNDPITTSEAFLHKDDANQFYSHVEFIPRQDKFMKSDPMAQPTFSSSDGNDTWRVNIGDLVCIENPSLADDDDEDGKKKCPPGQVSKPPFAVGWRPCQILSLFRERVPKKLSKTKHWGPLQIEIRWFYRHRDLDDRSRRHEQSMKKGGGSSSKKKKKINWNGGNLGEIFESGHVVVLDASLLLGRLGLKTSTKDSDDTLKYPVPTVVNYCHRYYLHEEKDIIELYDRESMLTRGLECSDMLQRKGLKKASYKYLGLPPPRNNDDDIEDESLVTIPSPMKSIQYSSEILSYYYASCTITHPWSQLMHSNLLCPKVKRASFPKWQLCVGDIVAVSCDESTPVSDVDVIPGRDQWYPYRVPWTYCQVTAIFQKVNKDDSSEENTTSIDTTSLFCEIRWFHRISEAMAECQDTKNVLSRLEQISNDDQRTCEEILEGRQLFTINCGSLLGPVYIDEGPKSHAKNPAPAFLAQNRRTVSGTVSCDAKLKPHVGRTTIDYDPTLRVHRGIDISKLFKNSSVRKFILDAVLLSRKERAEQILKELQQKMEVETVEMEAADGAVAGDIAAESVDCERSPQKKRQLFDDDANGSSAKSKKTRTSANANSVGKAPQDAMKPELEVPVDRAQNNAKKKKQPTETASYVTRVSCSTDPFHVDVSALKSFYKVVELLPPVDSYDERFYYAISKQGTGQWKVKLGDTVTIEVEQTSKDSNVVHFPFAVPWAPAEVVSIYRLHKTKESCASLREKLTNNDQKKSAAGVKSLGYIGGEIMIEVRWLYRPYEIPGASKKKSESLDNGELEEVFETDQIDVISAGSILSPIRLHDVTKPSTVLSTACGMPLINYHCSRLWSIHRRSFVPSGSLSNRVSRGRMHSAYKAIFSKLERASSSGSTVPSRELTWKEAFQTTIQKLSLAEAAQDVQENGMVLSCREKERAQITSFLKKAISGLVGEDEETKTLKSSIFIAGPPGTGKTASVRSIMAELKKEQHEGLLPEFNFIALNGMELRHPFDAYVKFWEAVSGPRKERLPAGDAVNELEHYFCGKNDEDQGDYLDSDSEDVDAKEDEECEGEDVDIWTAERPVTVLMLDEIDYLQTKKETLMYNFFDWPLRATTARLVVIGISNTINLPENMSQRVQSRIGGDRCHFQAYNVQDTITILKTRLGMLDDTPGHPVFEEDAIKFAARKTANLSGDIRKAFNMCKGAAETVFEDYNSGKRQLAEGSRPIVRISDVQKGSRDMFTSIILKAVSCSTDYEALLLISLGALKRGREDGSFTVKDILTKIESISNASGEPRYMNARLSFADCLGIVNRISDAGIIQLKTYPDSPWPWVTSHLQPYEIFASYRDTRHSKLAEKHLAKQILFQMSS